MWGEGAVSLLAGPPWKRAISTVDTTGRMQDMIYINEQALYKLSFASRKLGFFITDQQRDIPQTK